MRVSVKDKVLDIMVYENVYKTMEEAFADFPIFMKQSVFGTDRFEIIVSMV